MTMKRHSTGQKGFTIVELMIATTVLSVILILSTVMITSIGNLYYKGVNQSRIQDDVRLITDDVTQHLQLSDQTVMIGIAPYPGDASSKLQSVCAGGARYTYVIGKKLGTSSKHVLWRDNSTDCTPVNLTLTTPSVGGSELMSPNSRLMDFTISPTSPYSVSVAAAFGDDDLLCSPSVSGSCSGSPILSASDYVNHKDIICRGGAGGQFCSTANLVTTASRRLN